MHQKGNGRHDGFLSSFSCKPVVPNQNLLLTCFDTTKLLGKYHTLVMMDNHSVVQVRLQGSMQDVALQYASLFHELSDRVSVRYDCHILFDDGSIVQHFCDIVSCGSNQFHTAIVRFLQMTDGRQRVRIMDRVSEWQSHESWSKPTTIHNQKQQQWQYQIQQINVPSIVQHRDRRHLVLDLRNNLPTI